MTNYREIIRLKNLKFSNVAISNSLCCSRNTVSDLSLLWAEYCAKCEAEHTIPYQHTAYA